MRFSSESAILLAVAAIILPALGAPVPDNKGWVRFEARGISAEAFEIATRSPEALNIGATAVNALATREADPEPFFLTKLIKGAVKGVEGIVKLAKGKKGKHVDLPSGGGDQNQNQKRSVETRDPQGHGHGQHGSKHGKHGKGKHGKGKHGKGKHGKGKHGKGKHGKGKHGKGHGRPKHSKKPTTEATTESAPPATPEAAPATPEAAPAAAPAVAARSAEPEPLDVLASLSHASDVLFHGKGQ